MFGVWLAASTKRTIDFATVAAYVVGAEVLWRMTDAALFWETGKYAVIALLLVGLARLPHPKSMRAPILYFALLTPGLALLTQTAVDFDTIRQLGSFNLSGPLTLAVAACFFRQCTFTREQLGTILIAALAPAVTIATLTTLYTFGSSNIVFQASSNLATSGGFGPNQVSSALSVGAVLGFLLLTTQVDLKARSRAVLFTAMVACSVQSAMTFSRGGLYMVGIATVAASFVLLRDRLGRRMVIGHVVAIAIAFGAIAPILISRTGGAIAQRFEDADTTHRLELTKIELQLWAEHPIFGTGVGLATSARAVGRTPGMAAAHTEWTRMLAEHGLFGLVAALVLLAMIGRNVVRAGGPVARAIVVALACWAGAYLSINAMRIAAPSFLLGLTCATLMMPVGWRPSASRRLRVAAAPSTS